MNKDQGLEEAVYNVLYKYSRDSLDVCAKELIALVRESEWISVEDEPPPEYNSYVLVEFETNIETLMQCVCHFVSQPVHAFDNPRKVDKWYVYPGSGHALTGVRRWKPLQTTKEKDDE